MKFFQNILLVMICFVVLIGFGLNNNAFAQYKSSAKVEGFDVWSGLYDACDVNLKVTFEFDVVLDGTEGNMATYVGDWDNFHAREYVIWDYEEVGHYTEVYWLEYQIKEDHQCAITTPTGPGPGKYDGFANPVLLCQYYASQGQ